jgi:hypothetical protein
MTQYVFKKNEEGEKRMRKNLIVGLMTAAIVVFGATSASALAIDATVLDIFTTSSSGTSIGDLAIDGEGNATGTLAAGNAIMLNIHIDNTAGESLETLGASITFQGDQTDFLAGIAPGSILAEAGFGGASLARIAAPAIKGNTPNPAGTAGDVWVQALAYGSPGGVNGTGTQTADIQLLFIVSGASGSDQVDFGLSLTTGDVIEFGGIAVATTFSGAVVNVPEPGTALLMGLGLAGLAGAGRRKS